MRTYLLKMIEKHFFVLSKDEVSNMEAGFELSDYLVGMLKRQDANLNNEEKYLSLLHPSFAQAEQEIVSRIEMLDKNKLNVWEQEKLFKDCLLFISIYYHYSAVLYPNVMANFLRLVLLKKILLT